MKTKIKILKIINENPGITFQELLKILSFSKGNLSIHLKNLEYDNFIIRKKINEISFRLHPTKKGKDLYLQMILSQL